MAIINAANASKNDLIVGLVQRELKSAALLAPLLTDVSAFATKGMKSIEFPKLTSFTASARSFGSAGTATAITETVDTLALNQNLYIQYIIDTTSALQSSIEWESETAKRAGSAHGRAVDSAIVTALEAVGTPCGTAGSITKAIILAMRQGLKKSFADMSKVVLVVAADQETALLNIDEFTRNDIYGAGVNGPIATGMVGRIYGMPVLVHAGLADGAFYMFEQGGVAIGWQSAPKYGEEPALDYGVGSVKRAVDQLFGVCGLQLISGVSPLVYRHGAS